MKKRIVICADDYGQARAISQAIVNLIENGILSATSCMVNSPDWPEHAQLLVPYQNKVDLGLHFNLTEGHALSPAFKKAYGDALIPLPTLLRLAFRRKLQLPVLMAECHAQLDLFAGIMGRMPDFIDGHQHIHQFPVIRDALLKVYYERSLQSYIRVVNPRILSGGITNAWKKTVITLTGSKRMRSLIQRAHIPCNESFAGIYDFAQAANYPELFRLFLNEISDEGLIMCHPGLPESADSIGAARAAEYAYLSSQQFRLDCVAYDIKVCRLPRPTTLSMSEYSAII